jgi:hypothetical protein
MNGSDFEIFWYAARAVLEGRDPYAVYHFFYPLPFAYLISIFGLLPKWWSFGVWIGVNLLIVIIIFRKNFWHWIFYLPILHLISSGQVELLWWVMERGVGRHWRGALLAAIMTLKPQAALILLPWHVLDWLRNDRKTLIRWAVITFFIWATPLLWRPTWIVEWINETPPYTLNSASNTPGVLGFIRISSDPIFVIILAIIAAIIFIWGQFQTKEIARASAILGSPLGLFYSTMALLGCAPPGLLVPVSLVAAALSLLTFSFVPFILLPIAVLVWHGWLVNKFPVKAPASST